MAVLVEHEKRKKEILEKSLELFIEEGYEDVTFQKIADRCAITRTTLYIYFKNKREIFLWSIKQLTGGIEKSILKIMADESLDEIDCLKKIFTLICAECEKNARLFHVLLDYLLQLKKSEGNPRERVKRRVIRLEHLLTTVILRGQKKGLIRNLPVKEIDALLFSLIESALFKISVYGEQSLEDSRLLIEFTIDSLKTSQE
ncbi:MAG: TetR/AcrR family transcriptional regulator [Treponema sp.]|nr:TetR/AcrR family transcriptional regulator [Treponema sp.]